MSSSLNNDAWLHSSGSLTIIYNLSEFLDIRSYFRSAFKSSVVSISSDSEDGNESEIDVQPNPPKKYS